MQKPSRPPLFAADSQEDEAEQRQQEGEQQQDEGELSWLSCGRSFDPAVALQYPGLPERQRELQQQQRSLLVGEYVAKRAAKEQVARHDEALVAGEICLERDEREHRKQLKLRQQNVQQQQAGEDDADTSHRRRERLQRSRQQQQLGVLASAEAQQLSGSSSDDSVILIEASSKVVSRTKSRKRQQPLSERPPVGGLVSPSVLKALAKGAAAQETIWDSYRMQTATAAARSPQQTVCRQKLSQKAHAARSQQEVALLSSSSYSSSSSSSSSRAAGEAVQGEATSFPVMRRRRRKAAAAAAAAADADSADQVGTFSVFVEGLDTPLVFAVADSRLKDREASASSSGDEAHGAGREGRQWEQQQELLLLQQQDRLLMLCRQKPRDVELWVLLVVMQEQQLLLQQPLLLSAVSPEHLLQRQQDVLDVACSGGDAQAATSPAAAAGVPPTLLVLRRLLLLRQTKAPLSDQAWLRTASLVGRLSAALDSRSSSNSILDSTSQTRTATAVARCLCSAAAVTPQYSETSMRLLLSKLLSSAAEGLTAAAQGRAPDAAAATTAAAAATAAPAAATAALATANAAASSAAAASALEDEYRTCSALLQELLFGFLLPLEVRAGRVAAAATTAQAVAQLALLHLQRDQRQRQQLQHEPTESPGGQATPLDKLQEAWTGHGDGCRRAGEPGWQQQQQWQAASNPAAAVYLQLCAAAEDLVTATRERRIAVQQQVLQSATAASLDSLLSHAGGSVSCSDSGIDGSSSSNSKSSNSTSCCCKDPGLKGFAAYWAADFALSAAAWRSRLLGCAAAAGGPAAAAMAAAAAAEQAAAAGKVAAAAAITAANDASKVGDAAAAANAAAATAAANPSSAALDGLRRAAEAAAAAAAAATKSATAARTAAAAAAAADLKLPAPYGTSGDTVAPVKQWDLLRPILAVADAVLSAAAAGVSCCSRVRSTSRKTVTGTAAGGRVRGAVYNLLLGVLDSLGAPTLHRFPSGHPRLQRADTAAAAAADGARLRAVVLCLRQAVQSCGDKTASSSSINSAAPFAFWWPPASLMPVMEDRLMQRQMRAATGWVLAQRQLWRAVLKGQQQLQQQHEKQRPQEQQEDDDDTLSIAASAAEASTAQAFAALLCSQALVAFPDDRLLLYCLLCLCPSPKIQRLVLKQNEAEPAFWLTFASSLFLQAATKRLSHEVHKSSSSGAAVTDKKSPQALLLQGRKVLLTCCSAFAAHAPLAASWAFLELTTAAAGPPLSATAAAASLSSEQQQQQQGQQQQPQQAAAVQAFLPQTLSFGWPWACWTEGLTFSKGASSEGSFSAGGVQQTLSQQLPFEGWGLSAAGLHVALCSADRSFHAFDPLQPDVPQRQQQQQQQAANGAKGSADDLLAGGFSRSHVSAACAVLLQRSRIIPADAAATAAVASSAFPLLTSSPWANIFMALLLHAALSPTPAAVWGLFQQHRDQAASASAAAAATACGKSCCVCCCGCFLSNIEGDSPSSPSGVGTSDSCGSSSSGLPLSGLCSNAETARCEELSLGFVLGLLLTLSRASDKAAPGCEGAGDEARHSEAAAEDLDVLLGASCWMLRKFPSNPFFLAVHSQLLLRLEGREGRRRLRCLYTDLLRGPPWPAATPAVSSTAGKGGAQWGAWPSAATLEAAFLSEWLLASRAAEPVSMRWQERYALWASSSSAPPFAVLQRLPGDPYGLPCATAVLQREKQFWVYFQALLLCSSSSSYPGAVDGAVEASFASLDGTCLAWLCEGLCPPQEQQPHRQQQQQGLQQAHGNRQEQQPNEQQQQQQMREMEERLLQAVSQCPFSKRLWLLLLHALHVKRRLAGAAAETALTGGASAAEEVILLLDEALQRGVFFYADPLAALATP
ncbi:hypothetical protein Efla_001925 [Eimeria flavescens]